MKRISVKESRSSTTPTKKTAGPTLGEVEAAFAAQKAAATRTDDAAGDGEVFGIDDAERSNQLGVEELVAAARTAEEVAESPADAVESWHRVACACASEGDADGVVKAIVKCEELLGRAGFQPNVRRKPVGQDQDRAKVWGDAEKIDSDGEVFGGPEEQEVA